jgi:6-phosphogluconolactonase
MTTKVVPGVLIATPDVDQVARESATRMAKVIREAIEARGSAAIALSGGNTPREAYALLAREALDWQKVDVFWVDERAVPPDDDRSNYHWAKKTLIDPAKIPADRVHRMQGEAADLDAAARAYEQLLRVKIRNKSNGVPSFDLMVMGIGDDGHTASLFPGEPHVNITDRLVVHVPPKGSREARLTVTPPIIEAAMAAIVLVVGKGKNGPLERAWLVAGSLSDTPARIIRNVRGSITWVIDRAAGGLG